MEEPVLDKCRRYHAGLITEEELFDFLSNWQYPTTKLTDGLWDNLLLASPGAWDEIIRAYACGYITSEFYKRVVTHIINKRQTEKEK